MAVVAALVLMAPGAWAQPMRRVTINTSPQGATIRLDSRTETPLGTTPLRTQIRQGPHTLYFELANHVPGQFDVNVTRSNQTITIPALVATGSIIVSSTPAGAQIFLDAGNTPVGTTPGTVGNVPPGQHLITLQAPGMEPHTERVSVEPGRQAAVTAQLRPPPVQAPTTGTIRVSVLNPAGPVPPETEVTFEGRVLRGPAHVIENVQPGTYVVQVNAPGYRTSIIRDINVTAGQSTSVPVELQRDAPTGGGVRVIVPTQGAQVFLDGELIEGTPPQRQGVPAGTHSLRVTAPGRATVTREITVTAGQVTAVEIPDLAVAQERGRVVVRTSTAGARVSIDGEDIGGSPVDREVPAGRHRVVVRAEGFEDYTQECVIEVARVCEVVTELRPRQTPGTLRIAVRPPTVQATVQVDNGPPQPAGDLAGVPAGQHTIVVSAANYQPHTQSIMLNPGETREVTVDLQRIGPSRSDVARRRAAISTWGALPLSAGDVAFDLGANIGGVLPEFRATMGFLPNNFAGGLVGVDGGIAIRPMIIWNEFELHARAGVRLLNDLLAIGGEFRVYGALGTSGSSGSGLTAQLNLSFQTTVTSDEEAAGETDPRARSNRLGSFAFSLHLGVEVNNDTVGPGRFLDQDNDRDLCENRDELNAMAAGGMSLDQQTCVISSSTRGYFGGIMEIGLGRHWNAFGGLDFYLAPPAPIAETSNTARRPITTDFWGTAFRQTFRLGLTYKF